MGGTASVGGRSEAAQMIKYEYLSQREKPPDASDITSLEIAKIEICKLRNICRQVDPLIVQSAIENMRDKSDHTEQDEEEKQAPIPRSQDELTAAVQHKFTHRIPSLQQAFRTIDYSNTGYITKQEFLSVRRTSPIFPCCVLPNALCRLVGTGACIWRRKTSLY